MFTTFRNSSDKLFIHSNVVRNWATFLPHIQPVLFTTFHTGPLIDLAKAEGWIVYPYNETNEYGTPFLKPIYKKALEDFNAYFYAYCNGDILFSEGLPKTLQSAVKHINKLNTTMIVGRRWDYELNTNISVYKDDPLWKPEKVSSLANAKFSNIHGYYAKDYFFMTKDYPWRQITNVVVGRIYYDNYLVLASIHLNVTTIDATDTILALHETGEDGIHAGLEGRTMPDRYYNAAVSNYSSDSVDFRILKVITKVVDGQIEITSRQIKNTKEI